SSRRRHTISKRDWSSDVCSSDLDDQAPQFPGQPAARILLTNSKGIAAGHTWVIGPKFVNTFHWGFTRQGLDFTGGITGPRLALRSEERRVGKVGSCRWVVCRESK